MKKEELDDETKSIKKRSENLSEKLTAMKKLLSNMGNGKLLKDIEKEYQEFMKNQELDSTYEFTPRRPYRNRESNFGDLETTNRQTKVARYAGKSRLNSSLYEAHTQVNKTRAGKEETFRYYSAAAATPTPVRRVQKHRSLNSDSYETKRLPHVSVISGKVEEALDLPSYRQFLKGKIPMNKIVQKESLLKKFEDCSESIENSKYEMEGLAIFCDKNKGVPWNIDRKVLLKLGMNPGKQASIIKAYNDKHGYSNEGHRQLENRRNTNISSLASPKLTKRQLQTRNSRDLNLDPSQRRAKSINSNYGILGRDPKELVERCTSRFKKSQENEEVKLIHIIERMKQDKPIIMRQKAGLIFSDQEKYRDPIHSLNKFEEYKRIVEVDRKSRMEKNKSQAVIYTDMLTHLKKRKDTPKGAEIKLLELTKGMLEGGWVLDNELLDQIQDNISEDERLQIQELVSIIKSYL